MKKRGDAYTYKITISPRGGFPHDTDLSITEKAGYRATCVMLL
jgi:hypothetical protein